MSERQMNIRGRILEMASYLSAQEMISVAAEIINQSGMGTNRRIIRLFLARLDPANHDAFREELYDQFLG